MQRSLVSTLVACLLLALAGGSRGNGDTGPTGNPALDTDTGVTDRGSVLIYYGHGGVGPEGLEGSMAHLESSAWLEGAGLTVSHTSTWPGSFDTYRMVILTAPGTHDSDIEFAAVERADLLNVMNAGGTVVVESEPGSLLNDDVLNALVWDLGGSMYTTGEALDGAATPWGDHELTSEITTIGLELATEVERGDDTCLLVSGDHCVGVAAASGAGWLVLLGDGNLLSNVSHWSDVSYDNARFLSHLAQLY